MTPFQNGHVHQPRNSPGRTSHWLLARTMSSVQLHAQKKTARLPGRRSVNAHEARTNGDQTQHESGSAGILITSCITWRRP